ncbi:uncharacterized protein LOC133926350 isoform X2 [Phragmites australis]|uniref:uncharacterized protein LOC133926350 isoform X2 n=1 Tax=Phragmites australis TaxID=29695 RepID=UPI002D766054|nr:uncharacterized protein LOC133926350 isoform X2 [Phragmites australis]
MASSKRGGGRSPFKDLTNTPNTAGDHNSNVGGSMASSKRGGGRSPFNYLTNTPNTAGDNNSNVGGSMTSDTQPPLVDARERKRQRDRDRYVLKKDEILKKRREAYRRKKAEAAFVDVDKHQSVTFQNDQMGSGQSALPELGCTPNARGIPNVVTESCTPISGTTKSTFFEQPTACNKENMPPGESSYWESLAHAGNKSASNARQSRRTCEIAHRQELTTEQIEASRARYRARYANMTPEQRQARRDRDKARYALRRNTPEKIEIMRMHQRVHYANVTPEDKQAKRDHEKALKDLRRNTLSQDSIAMQNPMYVPEVVPLTVDASGPHGSTVTRDWSIPAVTGTPIYIQSACDQMPDVEIPNMAASQRSRIQRVTPGERQALLARRNEHFAKTPTKKRSDLTQESPTVCAEDINGSEPPTQSILINNEDTPATPDTNNAAMPPTRPPVNDDGDDDGVIFEEDSEDEEGYMFGGQDRDINEDVEFDQADDDSTSISSVPDTYDHVYSNIPSATHMLKPVENCQYCNAKKFEHETKGFCCRNGKIKLSTTDTPPELMRLWSSADADARHFRDNIRFFNGHFSFTSLYCHLDSETTDMRKHGIYTFRAHGQMYHNIRSFGRDGSEPKHLELYFYDDDPSLELRYRRCREEQYQQDKDVIRKLVGILRGNPYSEQLRSMGQVQDLDDYHVTLNLDHRLDQRTYNVPATSEVAAVWVEGSER